MMHARIWWMHLHSSKNCRCLFASYFVEWNDNSQYVLGQNARKCVWILIQYYSIGTEKPTSQDSFPQNENLDVFELLEQKLWFSYSEYHNLSSSDERFELIISLYVGVWVSAVTICERQRVGRKLFYARDHRNRVYVCVSSARWVNFLKCLGGKTEAYVFFVICEKKTPCSFLSVMESIGAEDKPHTRSFT